MQTRHLLTAILTTTALVATLQAQDYRYAFFDLRTLGGNNGFAWGLNEQGEVVGSSVTQGNVLHAALWRDTEVIDLGTLGGTDSSAIAVNSVGSVVGWALPPGGGIFDERAALWRGGQVFDLGTLGGDVARANAINDSDIVVGQSYIDGSHGRIGAFIWQSGVMTLLDGFESESVSFAYGINLQQQVVGRSTRRIGQFAVDRAALWQNGQISDLGTLRLDGGGFSQARDINASGTITGWADNDADRSTACIWIGGRVFNIHTLGSLSESFAYAINNSNKVVGIHALDSGSVKAFIWERNRGMQLLADLVPPQKPLFPYAATGINDAGQISGYSTPRSNPESYFRAFLISPVTPTMSLEQPSPGTAGTDNTITVSEITPGARVTFLYSRHGGGTRIPGCDLQQNALQLDNPTVIGTAIANGNGVATITRPVPLIARGQTILFQAVVQNECAISQLVVHRFD